MKKLFPLIILMIMSFSYNTMAQIDSLNIPKRILLIHSYSVEFPTFRYVEKVIQSRLLNKGVLVETEFMNSKEFNSDDFNEYYYRLLKVKLKARKAYDAILCAEDNALNFVLKYQDSLFHKTPIVFLGVNNESLALKQDENPWVTGVIEKPSIQETIEFMKQLNPKLKEVIAICDQTTSGREDLIRFYSIRKKFKDLVFMDLKLSEYSFENFKGKISRYEGDKAFLLLSAFRDKDGNFKDFDSALQLILSKAKIPVYHLWMHGMGKGITGGKLISHEYQALTAVQFIEDILNSKSVSEMKVHKESPNVCMLDFKQAKRFDLHFDEKDKNLSIVGKPDKNLEINVIYIYFIVGIVLALASGFIYSLSNIRKRKLVEKELIEVKQHYENLFLQNSSVMFIIDPGTGYIKDANPAACKFYAYTHSEITSLHVSDITKAKKHKAEQELRLAAEGSRTYFTNKHHLKTGGIKDVEVYSGRIVLKQKIYLYNIVHDITKRKEVEQELVEAKMKAEESDQLKTMFLANMSHEIRTPMNSIIGFSEILKREDVDDDKKMKFIDIIITNTRQLLRIITDIVDLSKIESGQVELELQPTSLDDVMIELQEFFNQEIRFRKQNIIDLKLGQETGGTILTDRARIRQVLNNLLDNAIKYTERGNIEFGYRFFGNNNILFYVKDSGIGIAKNKHEMIFERFTQGDEHLGRNFGGNGLGLSISKKLVEMMGGKIWVESDLGQGASFYFTHPFQPGMEGNTILEDKFVETLELADKSILIVEDVLDNYLLMSEFLTPTKVNLIHAQNGEEGLELLKQRDVDLILMDLQMPVMDGFTALSKIQEQKINIPVVAQTAYAQAEDKDQILEYGFNAFLSKPIIREELFDIINRYLG